MTSPTSQSVYIETSVVSYLTARPSSDLLAAAWQKATVDWWELRREQFEIFASMHVVNEAAKGDQDAVARRLAVLEDIALLPITDEMRNFAEKLVQNGALPAKAADDALHVAIAAISETNYLLTWNCRHIDNAETKPIVRSLCAVEGYPCPEICTPNELMGELSDGG